MREHQGVPPRRAKRKTPKKKIPPRFVPKGEIGARSKYIPNEPDTWPKAFHVREEKMLYLFDVLYGMDNGYSPRNKILEDFEDESGDKRNIYGTVTINKEMMRTILDIEAMYKMGGFGKVPMVVAEKWASAYQGDIPFDPEKISDPNPEVRGWTPRAIVKMALETFRMYLMGTCPMTRRIITKVRLLDGEVKGLESLANAVYDAAEFESSLELDEYD